MASSLPLPRKIRPASTSFSSAIRRFQRPLVRVGVTVHAVVVGAFVGVEPYVDPAARIFVAGCGVGLQRQDVGAHQLRQRFHSVPPFIRTRTALACASSPSASAMAVIAGASASSPSRVSSWICDLAHETVDVHPAAGTGPAARGQRVIGARGVVPGAFGRVIADEDAARGRDLGGDAPCVAHRDDQVLRGIGVGERDLLVFLVEQYDPAVGQRIADRLAAAEIPDLLLDGPGYLPCETLRRGRPGWPGCRPRARPATADRRRRIPPGRCCRPAPSPPKGLPAGLRPRPRCLPAAWRG